MRVWTPSLIAVLVVIVLAIPARAQEKLDTGFIGKDIPVLDIDDCPPPDPVSQDQLRKRAFEHFERGEVLYVQGDYRGAVKELVAAYCISPVYSILKDIGQAYERELDYARAIAYLSRYVQSVPKDAQKTGACATDPQEDKRNVLARIAVLARLRAKILINTDPPDSKITLSNDAGVAGRGTSGQELEVQGGRYQMLIEHDGFKSVTQEIRAEIGKPYTIFQKLEPLKGRVRVRVVPADARLFLDKRQVGTGAFESDLPGGRYTLSAEAQDRLTVSREIEVIANRDTPLSFELPPKPQFGRRQLLIYSGIGGGAIGGTLFGATGNGNAVAAGVLSGAAAGFLGTYFATDSDLPLGTSSLTITSSLIGGTVGGFTATIFTDNPQIIAPIVGGGLLAGGAVGYYAGERLHIKPGDAAVINSGAIWGTVSGALFAESFKAGGTRVGAGLILSGLSMGTIGGILLTHYYDVSRTRAVLIDLGGVVGVFVGFAVDNVVGQAQSSVMTSTSGTTNYVLGGMAAGLIVAGVLTRNMDMPKLSVVPVVSKTTTQGSTTATFGVGGAF